MTIFWFHTTDFALKDLPTAFIFVFSFSLRIADTHINMLRLPFDLPYSSRMFRVDEQCGTLHCPWGAAFRLVMRPVGDEQLIGYLGATVPIVRESNGWIGSRICLSGRGAAICDGTRQI
jgi:hypothetical protein